MIRRRISLVAQSEDDLILKYITILKGISNFTDLETKIASEFVKEGTLSNNSKNKVRERLNMNKSTFSVMVHRLKKKSFFKDGDINPLFLPKYNDSGLELILKINLNAEKN
jgi:hypothetical protein